MGAGPPHLQRVSCSGDELWSVTELVEQNPDRWIVVSLGTGAGAAPASQLALRVPLEDYGPCFEIGR